MIAQVQRRLFTVDEYTQMIEAGIFGEDDRLELLDGEIVDMSPIGSRHMACVNRLNRLFVSALGAGAIVSVQNPIRLSELSEPEPDLALLSPRDDFYEAQVPSAADVLLLIEVADTSIEHDRTVKLPLYARAGVNEVWLVDLAEGVIDAYRSPSNEGYLLRQRYLSSQNIEMTGPLALSFPVQQILG